MKIDDEHVLPCDFIVGHVRFGKGVKLEIVRKAAQRWLEKAQLQPTDLEGTANATPSAKTMLELADILSLIRGAYYTEAPDGTDEGIWNAACEHIEEGILALRSPAPSVGVEARQALDNSQSLLTMIYQLNTNGSVSEHDWETDGLADLITKQITENRAALTPSQQSGAGEVWRSIESAPEDQVVVATDGKTRFMWNRSDPEELNEWLKSIGSDFNDAPTHWFPLPPLPAPLPTTNIEERE